MKKNKIYSIKKLALGASFAICICSCEVRNIQNDPNRGPVNAPAPPAPAPAQPAPAPAQPAPAPAQPAPQLAPAPSQPAPQPAPVPQPAPALAPALAPAPQPAPAAPAPQPAPPAFPYANNKEAYDSLYNLAFVAAGEVKDLVDGKTPITQDIVNSIGIKGLIAYQMGKRCKNWKVLYEEWKKNLNLKVGVFEKESIFRDTELNAGLYYIDESRRFVKIGTRKGDRSDIDLYFDDMKASVSDIKWYSRTSSASLSTTDFSKIEELISLLRCNGQIFYKVLEDEKNKFKRFFENYDAFKAAKLEPGIYCIKSNYETTEIASFIKLENQKPANSYLQARDREQSYLSKNEWEIEYDREVFDTYFNKVEDIIDLLNYWRYKFYIVLKGEKDEFKKSFEDKSAFVDADLEPGIYCIKDSPGKSIKSFIKLEKHKPAGYDLQAGDKLQEYLVKTAWEICQ